MFAQKTENNSFFCAIYYNFTGHRSNAICGYYFG